MINATIKFFYLLCLVGVFAVTALAEEGEEVVAPKALYYELKPSFVTNFGDASTKKIKFVKTDISLRVFGDEALKVIMAHDALIRHQVVMLLSKQTEETMAVIDGQEKLRLQILDQVKAALKQETGKEQVDDLLFTTFVIQR